MKSDTPWSSNAKSNPHTPHCICLFIFFFIITIPFMQWITAEITTPIRQMMIGDKGIQIYVKPEEWRELRGITTIVPPTKDSFYNFHTLGWEGGEHDDVSFPEFLEVEGIKYEAEFIDKKTRIILYTAETKNILPAFWILTTDYRLYYDPVIHKTIAIAQDAAGGYPTPLAGGGKLLVVLVLAIVMKVS